MAIIRSEYLVLILGIILISCSSCSTIGGELTSDKTSNSIPDVKKNSALLLVTMGSAEEIKKISLLVEDKQIGELLESEVIAIHLNPGNYRIRSAYQSCFPAEVTLRKGEILLVETVYTKKGIYFKPVTIDRVEGLVNKRHIQEVVY
jgi:hypothetical protein